jgi:hypothetical protein
VRSQAIRRRLVEVEVHRSTIPRIENE